jgi:hypothetical protein
MLIKSLSHLLFGLLPKLLSRDALSRVPNLRRVVHIPRRRACERIPRSHRFRPGTIDRVLWPDCGLFLYWLRGTEGPYALVVGFYLCFFCGARQSVSAGLFWLRYV